MEDVGMLLFLAAKQTPPLGAAKDEFMRELKVRYSHQVELKVRDVPRNLKDEDKIETAKKARYQEAVEEMREFNRKQHLRRIEAYVKSAADPCIGQIAAIALSAGNSSTVGVLSQNGGTICERDVLAGFADDVSKLNPDEKAPTLVVQDSALVRFIWQRCVINFVELPVWWPVGSRPFDPNRVHDTMAYWGGPARGDGSLETLAAALKLPAFEPLELMLALQQGDWAQIAIDTQNDVRRLRAVTFRLRGRAALDADVIGLGGKVAGKPDLQVVASDQSAVA
jgi:hypothetical protein